jgi:hypothetical protein
MWSQVRWCTPVIQVLRRRKQEDPKFKASLSYIVRAPRSKKIWNFLPGFSTSGLGPQFPPAQLARPVTCTSRWCPCPTSLCILGHPKFCLLSHPQAQDVQFSHFLSNLLL